MDWGPSGPRPRHNTDLGCVACAVDDATVAVEFAGVTSCPDGYDEVYNGTLHADYSTHRPEASVCIPTDYEPANGSSSSFEGGHLFYPLHSRMFAIRSGIRDARKIGCRVCTTQKKAGGGGALITPHK